MSAGEGEERLVDVGAAFVAGAEAPALVEPDEGAPARARSSLEHGQWLLAQGRADKARPLLAAACETFERLQARPWLERLEAAEASAPAEVPT